MKRGGYMWWRAMAGWQRKNYRVNTIPGAAFKCIARDNVECPFACDL